MAANRALSIEDGNLTNGGSIISSRNKAYKDIDLQFLAKPNGDIFKKTDAAAVKQSMKNLLMTGLGERPFRPALGGNLGVLLFENATTSSTQELENNIRVAVSNYEPRAQILKVNVQNNLDRNEIFVGIEFKVINTSEIATLETTMSRLR